MSANLVVIHSEFERANRDVIVLDVSDRPCITDLLARYADNAPDLTVSINGQVIPASEWDDRRLQLNEQLVVVPRLQKSGILSAIFTILVVIYAPYLVNYLATSAGWTAAAGTFAVSTFAGVALTIGVSMLGGYIVNALLGPSKPSLPGVQSFDSSPTYSWQPLTTQTAGIPISKAYGTLKLYGNIIAGYIENTGDSGQQQYANALIDLGMGPFDTLSDFKINDQDISVYKGVTIVTRLGNLDQDIIPAFNDTSINRSMNTKVVSGSPVIWTTPGNQYNALEVVLTCPNGLYHANDQGGLDVYSINVVVEASSDGGATWVPFSLSGSASGVITSARWSYGRWVSLAGSTASTPRMTFWYEDSSGSSDYADHTEGGTDADEFKGRLYWHWMEAGDTYSAVASTNSYHTFQGKSPQPIRKTYRIADCVLGTTYKVRITNQTADITDSKWADDVYLTAVNEIAYDDFQYPRTVLVAIRALGTDQLSGSFKFSCLAKSSIVRTWNGSVWTSEYSNNPAWVTWDILTQPVFNNDLTIARYDGFDPSRLDIVTFYAWAQWCDELVPAPVSGTEKRCCFDGVFETAMTMWETALEVCATARAQLITKGTKVYVIYDHVRSGPTQLFSVGNTSIKGFNEIFLPLADRASSIEVQYSDAAQGYARDSITVVNPNVTEQAAARTQIALRGVTRSSQAWREVKYRLAKNELLKRSGDISVDIDALAASIGDLVWVQNDVPLWGEGGRAGAGSTTTTLVLDKSVTLESGKSYEVSVRLRDDTIVAKRTVITPAGATTSLAVSVAFPTAPEQYDVWAFGEVNKSVKEFLVTEIVRDGESRLKLGLIEYNATVHNGDLGIPTVPTPNISASTGPALTFFYVGGVAQPFVIEGMEKLQGGDIDVFADLQFGILRPEAVSYVSIYYSIVGLPKLLLGTSLDNTYRVHGLQSGSTYEFTVLATNRFGVQEPMEFGLTASSLIIGLEAIPLDVQNFTSAFDGVGVTLSWSLLAEVDISTYEITDQLATAVGSVNSNKFRLLANGLTTGTWTWSIRALDTTGHYSATAATTSLTVLNPSTPTLSPGFNGPTLFNKAEVAFVWTSAETSLPLDYYDVRYSSSGGSWAAGTPLAKTLDRVYSINGNWLGVRRFWVAGVDAAGNVSTTAGYIDVDITAPTSVAVNPAAFEADLAIITWTAPSSVLPILEYEVFWSSTSSSDPTSSGTSLGLTKATRFSIPATWSGTRRWWVRAFDIAGNAGAFGYVDKTIVVAAMPTVSQEVIDNNVLIRWNAVSGSLPTLTYEIRKGDVFASAEVIGTKTGGFTSVFESLGGTYTYWVVAVDTAGNYGTEGSVAARVNQPPDYILANQTNSTFSGTKVSAAIQPNGTLLVPINIDETWSEHFTATRVATVTVAAGGTGYVVGDKVYLNTGTLSTHGFQATATVATLSGSAVATLTLVGPGSYSVAPSAAGATVAFTGVGTGLTVNVTTNVWASPSDQITAGFPVMIQPYVLTGSYQEPDIDLGQTITSRITVTYTGSIVIGSPDISITIKTSLDGSSWDTYLYTSAVYATFRYLRVKVDVSGYGNDAYTFAELLILVAAKLHSEVGTVSATGATGTIVNFPSEFLSVTSIVTSPQQVGTITPVITVHNFRGSNDAVTYSITANVCTVTRTAHDFLTGQKVKLSFSTGLGINGIYTITGVPTADTFTVAMVVGNSSGNGSCISQSMRVYAFNYSTGAAVTCDVGYSIKGYR